MINFHTSRVVVKGPFTKEQQAAWDRFHEHLAECDDTIAEFEAMLKNEEQQSAWPRLQELLTSERERRRSFVDTIEKLRERWSLSFG